MKRLSFLISALLLLAATAVAQQPVNTAEGLDPSGTYQTGSIDTINLMNGGVYLSIPLGGGAPQRGAVSAQVVVVMNSKGFYVAQNCGTGTCTNQWEGSAMNASIVYAQEIRVYPVYQGSTLAYYEAVTADGSVHILETGVQENGVDLPGWYAIDGSGIYYNASTDTAISRDGIQTIGASTGSGTIEDANGNEVQLSGNGDWDTLGRLGNVEQSTTDTSGCTGQSPWTAEDISFPGYNGQTETYKLCYTQLGIHTGFNNAGIEEESGQQQVLETIIRPDSAAWSFTYASDQEVGGKVPHAWFNDLASVTLPTGGHDQLQLGDEGVRQRHNTGQPLAPLAHRQP